MDPQQPPVSQSPIYQETEEKNAKWLWFLIVLIIVGALVFAYIRGIGPFASLKGEDQSVPSPTPTSFPTTTPTPVSEASKEADIDKTEVEIKVLNGSGTPGLASVVKDLLEGKGWTVASIGNADSYDFPKTLLKFKPSAKKFEEALAADLSSKYSVETGEDLEASSAADVEVIVGAK